MTTQEEYNGQTLTTNARTQAFGVRMFTPAQNFGRRTSLTNSYDISGSYDSIQERSALTMDASLGLNQKLTPTTISSFTYNWTHNPLNQSLEIVGNNLVVQRIPDLAALA